MPRVKRLVLGALVLTAISASALALVRVRTSGADDGSLAESVRVTRRDIGSVVKATGVIKPRVGAEVKVGSRISGVVKRLYVQIGDTVRQGQLLAELDERDLVARRDEAAATLRQAEVNLEYARIDLERKRTLLSSGGVMTTDIEAAERTVSLGEQQVNGARATLAFAATQVEYARIIAPISGVVASVSTQEGETVAASFAAPTFLTLLDPSRLEVWTYVDETDIGRIRTGQRAQFTVDTYGDHAFDGRVTAVYPKPEIRDNVVDYVTVLSFTQPRDRVLRPEMTTTVRIALESRQGVLALPIRAVRWESGRAFVFIAAPRSTAEADKTKSPERRWVTTGARDESYVEIVSGLGEGDAVLIADINQERRSDS
jgi:HlyD family secretion protein